MLVSQQGFISSPMMLYRVHGVNILERSRILSSANPSGPIDSANGTTRITIPSTMCHAFGAGVGVHVTPGGTRDGRDRKTRSNGRPARIHRGPARGRVMVVLLGTHLICFSRDDRERVRSHVTADVVESGQTRG